MSLLLLFKRVTPPAYADTKNIGDYIRRGVLFGGIIGPNPGVFDHFRRAQPITFLAEPAPTGGTGPTFVSWIDGPFWVEWSLPSQPWRRYIREGGEAWTKLS